MPGRTLNAASYRMGFNGKENDREWGNTLIQDYGFRLYNPAIGKFLSVDPLMQGFPMLTPYQFASNSPVIAIDLDGTEHQIYYIADWFIRYHYGDAIDCTTAGQIYDGLWKSTPFGQLEALEKEIAKDPLILLEMSSDNIRMMIQPLPLVKEQAEAYINTFKNGTVSERTQAISEIAQMLAGAAWAKYKTKVATKTNPNSPEKKPLGKSEGASLSTDLSKIEIVSEGINDIKKHLSQFDSQAPGGKWKHNEVMLNRLDEIKAGKMQATETDKLFYSHEITEMEYMKSGMPYEQAHVKAAEKYGVDPRKDFDTFYTKEAQDALRKQYD